MITEIFVIGCCIGLVGFVAKFLGHAARAAKGEKKHEVQYTFGATGFYDPPFTPEQAPQKQRACTGLCIAIRGGELTQGETMGNAITRERAPEHVYRESPAPERVDMPIPVTPDSVFAKREKQRK